MPTPKPNEKIQRLIDRFLSETRSAIVLAGGVEISDERLRAMTVGEFLDLVYPNNVRLNIGVKPPSWWRAETEDAVS